MIGDLILFINKKWKQCFCIHNYKVDRIGIATGLYNGFVCNKCGKHKDNI